MTRRTSARRASAGGTKKKRPDVRKIAEAIAADLFCSPFGIVTRLVLRVEDATPAWRDVGGLTREQVADRTEQHLRKAQ